MKIKLILTKFKNFILKNPLLSFIFFISTIYFLLQHYFYLSWDFSAYVLNARYFFNEGTYFEILRPPLVPLILGIFLFLGKISEYIFILIGASLFFYASIIFADVIFKGKLFGKNFSRLVFYFFSLSGYVLFYGLIAGTELFSLSFLMLFIAFVLKKKVSGHFLGLAILARYNLVIFIPFLFFYRSYKIILKNLLLVFFILLPWLLYNYFNYGNFIASVIDSLSLNVLNRGYLIQPLTAIPFLEILGPFLLFFLVGLFVGIWRIIRVKNFMYENILLFLVMALIVFDFATKPEKNVRFLFNFVLPSAYFSSIGFFFLVEKLRKVKRIKFYSILILFVIFLVTIISLFSGLQKFEYSVVFSSAAKDIKELGLENCEILSPVWVPVAYYSENVYPFKDGAVDKLVGENKTILFFKNLESKDLTARNFSQFDDVKLYETEKYVFFSKGNESCAPKYVYNFSYAKNNFCFNLARTFEKIKIEEDFEKLCLILNKN